MMRPICLAVLTTLACGGQDHASQDPSGGGGSTAMEGSDRGGASASAGRGSAVGEAGGSAATGGIGGASNAGAGGATPGGSGGTNAGGSGGSTLTSTCDPLAPPTGAVIPVEPDQAAELDQIAWDAAAGATLVLAAGTYEIDEPIQLRAAGVTLRSASNDASTTIIDATYTVPEAIVVSASDVTLAHVTVMRAIDHPVHVYTDESGADIRGVRLYGVQLVDGGEQMLKVNSGGSGGYVDEGIVECSSFLLTDAGRPNVESCCGGCYTGGIDVHAGQGWVVRNNRFDGIYCDGAGLAEHAIHFWNGARDTLVENNTIVDCARGIGFGLDGGRGDRVYPDLPADPLLAHYGGVIRNNVIWANHAYYDTGIELQIASRPRVVHNTVVHGSGATGFFSSIDYRFADTDAYIANNLITRISARDLATATLEGNVEDASLDLFVDALGGDFHLAPSALAAIDQGAVVTESGVDLDGEPRSDGLPDVGADELRR